MGLECSLGKNLTKSRSVNKKMNRFKYMMEKMEKIPNGKKFAV